MYVSDNTFAVNSSNSTNTSDSARNDTSSYGTFFNDMVADILDKQNNKLDALTESLRMKNSQIVQSFSQSYIRQQTYTFSASSSALMSNISSYFDSSAMFNSSFALLEKWFAGSNDTQNSLINYLLGQSKEHPEETAGAVNDLFGVQKEVQNILAEIKSSSAASSSMYVSSALTAIDMEVEVFGAQNIFSSINLEVKIQKIQSQAVDSCAESDLLENGGNMIEFEGKYVNINVFLRFMDPIVLDLDGDGFDLRSVEDGVIYDIAGNGSEVQTGFVQGDDALLFLDSNGDGFCTSGKELFGNQEGAANGFAELSEYDENNDGVINSEDSVYKDLKVWNDLNGDGKSQADEIRTLEEAGVSELSLGYEDTDVENAGNRITQQGTFARSDGTVGRMVDVDFRYSEYAIFDY